MFGEGEEMCGLNVKKRRSKRVGRMWTGRTKIEMNGQCEWIWDFLLSLRRGSRCSMHFIFLLPLCFFL